MGWAQIACCSHAVCSEQRRFDNVCHIHALVCTKAGVEGRTQRYVMFTNRPGKRNEVCLRPRKPQLNMSGPGTFWKRPEQSRRNNTFVASLKSETAFVSWGAFRLPARYRSLSLAYSTARQCFCCTHVIHSSWQRHESADSLIHWQMSFRLLQKYRLKHELMRWEMLCTRKNLTQSYNRSKIRIHHILIDLNPEKIWVTEELNK
jgi:hypothetical protein